MEYKIGWNFSLLLIVWVGAFGYLTYVMASAGLYSAMIVCIVTLFVGVYISLHRPIEEKNTIKES